jgi:hypothetical protein
MKPLIRSIIVSVLLFLPYIGCDKSVTTENDPTPNLYQVSGCLNKSFDSDSCFFYRFGRTLAVDFCVTGNCCPDHDRFVIQDSIYSDTVFVTLTDTAETLCRCYCVYNIHTDFHFLEGESYWFIVSQPDSSGMNILYSEKVIRSY